MTDTIPDLIAAHEYDEGIFGGFYCLTCTPQAAYDDDPDLTVLWPCPPLREAGVTDDQAATFVEEHRAAVTAKHNREQIAEVLAKASAANVLAADAAYTRYRYAFTGRAEEVAAVREALNLTTYGAAVLLDLPESPSALVATGGAR